ncbi:3-hydroxyacyl-CoA dehydrogenase, partial [Ochromonadaceae sp. CCMP2298]
MFSSSLRKHCLSAASRGARSMSQFKKIGVVGLGLMGHGVAQVTAAAGFQVLAIEAKPEALEIGMKRIQDSLNKVTARAVKNGKETPEGAKKIFEETMARISTSCDIKDAHDCDLIIEAIIEKEDIKIAFYETLGPLVKPSCVFASNTSSLAITNMAVASGRPDKFVGLHFFNPVQVMKLVEVISTTHTDPSVLKDIAEFGTQIGKKTVNCGDTPGFIVNRLLVPFLTQAMAMVDRGEASVADIDVSMQLGAGHPMGPLHLSDYIGLDTAYSILLG